MPTYDYQCKECQHKFEAFQAIKDEPLKTCPKCGGAVKRLISTGVGLIFKGSGFYITDYKNKESGKSGKKPAKKEDKKGKGGKGEGTEKTGADKTVPEKTGNSNEKSK